MNLPQNRFSKGVFHYREYASVQYKTVDCFTYESETALFDVIVLDDGRRVYRKNMGIGVFRLPTEDREYYEAIERHFNLVRAHETQATTA